jgi:hypothetical protein
LKITISSLKDQDYTTIERHAGKNGRSLSVTGNNQTSTVLTRFVEELARVLSDDRRLEGKIRETESQLALIKKKISENLAHRYLNDGNVAMQEDLMRAEQNYERLMQALLDMKKNFEGQMRTLDEQIVQANIDHLKHLFEQKKTLLMECANGIDQKILECIAHVDEYKRLYADLVTLNDKLHELAADSIDMPESLLPEDLRGIIDTRIQHLRAQGRV